MESTKETSNRGVSKSYKPGRYNWHKNAEKFAGGKSLKKCYLACQQIGLKKAEDSPEAKSNRNYKAIKEMKKKLKAQIASKMPSVSAKGHAYFGTPRGKALHDKERWGEGGAKRVLGMDH